MEARYMGPGPTCLSATDSMPGIRSITANRIAEQMVACGTGEEKREKTEVENLRGGKKDKQRENANDT